MSRRDPGPWEGLLDFKLPCEPGHRHLRVNSIVMAECSRRYAEICAEANISPAFQSPTYSLAFLDEDPFEATNLLKRAQSPDTFMREEEALRDSEARLIRKIKAASASARTSSEAEHAEAWLAGYTQAYLGADMQNQFTAESGYPKKTTSVRAGSDGSPRLWRKSPVSTPASTVTTYNGSMKRAHDHRSRYDQVIRTPPRQKTHVKVYAHNHGLSGYGATEPAFCLPNMSDSSLTHAGHLYPTTEQRFYHHPGVNMNPYVGAGEEFVTNYNNLTTTLPLADHENPSFGTAHPYNGYNEMQHYANQGLNLAHSIDPALHRGSLHPTPRGQEGDESDVNTFGEFRRQQDSWSGSAFPSTPATFEPCDVTPKSTTRGSRRATASTPSKSSVTTEEMTQMVIEDLKSWQVINAKISAMTAGGVDPSHVHTRDEPFGGQSAADHQAEQHRWTPSAAAVDVKHTERKRHTKPIPQEACIAPPFYPSKPVTAQGWRSNH